MCNICIVMVAKSILHTSILYSGNNIEILHLHIPVIIKYSSSYLIVEIGRKSYGFQKISHFTIANQPCNRLYSLECIAIG